MSLNKLSGLILIILGITLAIVSAGEILLRLLLALIGIYIINWGMQRMGSQPLHWTVIRIWSRSRYDI